MTVPVNAAVPVISTVMATPFLFLNVFFFDLRSNTFSGPLTLKKVETSTAFETPGRPAPRLAAALAVSLTAEPTSEAPCFTSDQAPLTKLPMPACCTLPVGPSGA